MFLGHYRPRSGRRQDAQPGDARRRQRQGPAEAHADGGGLLRDEDRMCWSASAAGRTSSTSRCRTIPASIWSPTAMHHYAKGVAHATLGKLLRGRAERARFHESVGRIPTERRFLSNPAHDILAVGEENARRRARVSQGQPRSTPTPICGRAVARDDNLQYIEPWAWMHPPRHALAALLADQGHYEEAEQVYRDDLGLSGTDPALRPAPRQCLGAARPGRMPATARRDRGTAGAAGEACRGLWRGPTCRSPRRACAARACMSGTA